MNICYATIYDHNSTSENMGVTCEHLNIVKIIW